MQSPVFPFTLHLPEAQWLIYVPAALTGGGGAQSV